MSADGMTRTVLLTLLDKALRDDGILSVKARTFAYGENTAALMGEVMSELAEARAQGTYSAQEWKRIADQHLKTAAELREALRYYADAQRPEDTCGGGYWSLVDDGKVARDALAKAESRKIPAETNESRL